MTSLDYANARVSYLFRLMINFPKTHHFTRQIRTVQMSEPQPLETFTFQPTEQPIQDMLSSDTVNQCLQNTSPIATILPATARRESSPLNIHHKITAAVPSAVERSGGFHSPQAPSTSFSQDDLNIANNDNSCDVGQTVFNKKRAPSDLFSDQVESGPSNMQIIRHEDKIEDGIVKLVVKEQQFIFAFSKCGTVGEFTREVQETTGYECNISSQDGFEYTDAVCLGALVLPFTISAGDSKTIITSITDWVLNDVQMLLLR
ncbi:uncharacterized protein [Watersipora subatra]|uniref:uncharacterized protein isoform X3 n=1 Tax=Watersipora subatra TaxID=2589382 RepID=UPI00355BF0B8